MNRMNVAKGYSICTCCLNSMELHVYICPFCRVRKDAPIDSTGYNPYIKMITSAGITMGMGTSSITPADFYAILERVTKPYEGE